MLACICWLILLVFIFVIMCSIAPWWVVLLLFGSIFFYNFFLGENALFRIRKESPRPMKNLERVKREIEEKKKAEAEQNKQSKTDTKPQNNKTKTNMTSTIPMGGYASSYHHDDDSDYERYRAYKEEQAAYDDFIASMDMDND